MEKRNPWLVESRQKDVPGCQTCVVADRVALINQSADIAWLRRVLTWPDTQLTVQIAAMRRINALMKKPRASRSVLECGGEQRASAFPTPDRPLATKQK